MTISLLVNTVNIAIMANKIKNNLYCEFFTYFIALDAINSKNPNSSKVIDNIESDKSKTIIFKGLIDELSVKDVINTSRGILLVNKIKIAPIKAISQNVSIDLFFTLNEGNLINTIIRARQVSIDIINVSAIMSSFPIILYALLKNSQYLLTNLKIYGIMKKILGG